MDRTHTELVSDKRELLNNGAGPAEPATTADQAATNSNYLWPPAHDYTGPKNSHLYGNGMYGGLEVAPAREKVPVERRLRREMAMINHHICGVPAKLFCAMAVVIPLLVIAGVVVGGVIGARSTKDGDESGPVDSKTTSAADPS